MLIRRATAADAEPIAAIHTSARHTAMPSIHWAHTPDEDRHWVASILLPNEEVWVAEQNATLIGMMGLHEDWLNHLYLRPGHWRQGIGSALLAHAKTARPHGLRLWCFQVNARARSFYEHHGFTVAHLTDGADNEEREPDILYVWHPEGATA